MLPCVRQEGAAEDDAGLGSHVEEEVADAEAGEEAVAAGKDLVVGDGTEARVVGKGASGADELAAVLGAVRGLRGVGGSGAHANGDVEEAAEREAQAFVEVHEEAGGMREEGLEVVSVVVEEGALAIGADEGLPV